VEHAAAVPAQRTTRSPRWIAGVVVVGSLVALTLGLLSRQQAVDPTTYPGGYFDLWWSDPIHLKAWLATFAGLLGCVQLFTAAWIFRKLPFGKPPWVNAVHRWSGRFAFVLILPVAYHCIFRIGFQTELGTRVWLHSLAGCAFYGAYVSKVSFVRLHRFPRWVLPTFGGLVFTALIAAWYTSAYWFFALVGESW
jgi:hypothetical protein